MSYRTIIFLFLISITFSQELTKKEIKKCQKRSIEDALTFMEYPDFNAALEVLLPCEPVMKANAQWNYLVGKNYYYLGHADKALKYLEKAVKLPLTPDMDEYDLHWLYASALLKNKNPEKALEELKKCEAILDRDKFGLNNDPKNMEIYKRYIAAKKSLDMYMNYCRNAMKLMKTPVPVTIKNLGATVNSKYPDFGPVINADGTVLYFTSRRKGNLGELASDGFPYEDIYVSYLDEETGKWKVAKNIGEPINTKYHDATISLSADGRTMFTFKYKNNGDIYVSKVKEDGSWSLPKPLPKPINSKDYWEPSACLSADGKYLFFVSDRPSDDNPNRQRDIFLCKKLPNGKWSVPIRLPAPLNTQYEEDAPYLHPDGKTLYFSSDRPESSMGGFDIYYTIWDSTTNTFSEPKNLGYPVNTTDDDIYFVLAADGLHGYYASKRADGLGDKDIYLIDFTPPKTLAAKKETKSIKLPELKIKTTVTKIEEDILIPKSNLTLLKGIIYDKETKKPLKAKMVIIDLAEQDTYVVTSSNAQNGKYLITLTPDRNYAIFVEKEGYLPYSKNIEIPATKDEYTEIEQDIPLPPIKVGAKIALRNVFFDFDKATLRPESKAELDKWVGILKNNPSLKIEIGGHTDIRGSDEYNLDLSRRRAKAVYEYLKNKGISPDRMSYKGYGETQLLTKETTEEAHQLNRRVEIKIMYK